MKKSILWMMAAILTCGFATTSCTDGVNGVDNPVVPIPEPAQPDQASMFVENIKADGRYTPAKLAVGGRDVDIMRLDVADFEAAKAEFLKLLPEGVETTAFERTKFSEMFVEATYYLLNAPQENRKDSITFYKVLPGMNGFVGYAWIELPSDIKKALNVTSVIYMQAASNDDMEAIAKAILTIKCNGQIILEKTLADATVGENSLSWTLTQQETLNIGTRSGKMMLNWLTHSGKRGASEETTIAGIQNHVKEVI